MTRIITRAEINSALSSLNLMEVIEAGFVAYSSGQTVVPPVGELLLPNGEVHIKYGCLKGDDYYVIKVASGFAGNSLLGKSPNNGLLMLFSQLHGELLAILLDEGWLTDVRTAVAGAIVAKYMAPSRVHRIGIVGTGIQARLQLEYLQTTTDCRDVLVWGRGDEQLKRYQEDISAQSFAVETTRNSRDIGAGCNLIVTTTSSHSPLLQQADIQPGTHITAMGSDTPHKHELDCAILGNADIVVADSISQCLERGEISQSIRGGLLRQANIRELGNVVKGDFAGRDNNDQVTVADLTGVAVQDIQIAKGIYESVA